MAQSVSACPYGLCAAQDKGINGVPAVICTAGTTRFGAMCKVASQREAEVWSVFLRLLDGICQMLENHGQGGCQGYSRELRRTPEVVLRGQPFAHGLRPKCSFGIRGNGSDITSQAVCRCEDTCFGTLEVLQKDGSHAGTVHRLRHINDTYNIIRYKATRHRV